MKINTLTAMMLVALPTMADAADKVPLIDTKTVKETLAQFRDAPGLSLDFSDNKQLVALSLNKVLSQANGKSSFIAGKLSGDFKNNNALLATQEGLNDGVSLKLNHINMWFSEKNEDKSPSGGNPIAELAVAKLRLDSLKTQQNYFNCANKVMQPTGSATEEKPADDTLEHDLSKVEKSIEELDVALYQAKQKHDKLLAKNGNDIVKFEIERRCKGENEAQSKAKAALAEVAKKEKFEYYNSYYFYNKSLSYAPGSITYYNLNDSRYHKNRISKETLSVGFETGIYEGSDGISQKLSNDSFIWRATRNTFGVSYEEAEVLPSSAKEQELCQPDADATEVLKCFKGYTDTPIKVATLAVYHKYAATFEEDRFIKGMEYEIRYAESRTSDIFSGPTSKVRRWSVSVPVTFLHYEPLNAKAGISLNWKEFKQGVDPDSADKLTFGLFVTTGFDLSKF